MNPKPRPASWHPADFEPSTVSRPKSPSKDIAELTRPTTKMPALTAPTRKMQRIDSGLLRLARGDAKEANDTVEHPFGGLVPLRDDDCTDWRAVNARVIAGLEEIVHMPVSPLCSLLIVHLDGSIDFEELCRLTCADEEAIMDALDELECVGIIRADA